MVAKKTITLEFKYGDLAKAKTKLTQASNTVDEVTIQGILEFLKPAERIAFLNELWRVMKPKAKAQIFTPYWCSNNAYSDLRVEMPPIVEGWYFHLDADWRKANTTIDRRYKCDFTPTWGYGLHHMISSRNQEYQQHAVSFFKEAAQTLIASVTKK